MEIEVKEAEVKTNSRGLEQEVSDLADTYIALAKANVTRKAADAAAVSGAGITIAVLACFLLFFAALGLAWWVGDLLSSRIAGFFIVAGFFALLIVLLIAIKEQILYPVIRNKIVKKIYE